MVGSAEQLREIRSELGGERLQALYGNRGGMLVSQMNRYSHLVKKHSDTFGEAQRIRFFSAPGRTEIGGNHTDHNAGRVLAAAVNLDTIAAVTPNDKRLITIHSSGYPKLTVSLDDLAKKPEEAETSTALVRGIAARMVELGYEVGGFDAVVSSTVLRGSGLSSSAAYEVLVCAILDGLYDEWKMPPVLRAEICRFAENVYFGKPSGLMDQTASSVGGLVAIDFEKAEPVVQALQYDFSKKGYALVVVATGGHHGDLTNAYAAIHTEMEQVAHFFGEKLLRQVQLKQVLENIPALREKVSDRAILRALHFFDDNQRALEEAEALRRDDLPAFLDLVVSSGRSSSMLLQNVALNAEQQQIPLALELSRRILEGKGAWRVHGGGFAGTILAFVPSALLGEYTRQMDAVFGDQASIVLDIRPVGATEISFGGK